MGFLVRQLYIRQALQDVMDQPGLDKAISADIATPTSGPEPNPFAIQAVTSKLHNITFSPLYTLLPESWYFTK